MENKPTVLYRGLKINYNDIQNFQFSGVDLIVNYEPIIDKYGRKTVLDGNEYGVYMSDNLSMVETAYGNLHSDGISVNNNLSINQQRILIPSVAVIYEINTDGLDIRKPFISTSLRGHYNNGFQGEEWIADMVPAENYTLRRVRIGSDILHEYEDIDLSKNIEEEVKRKLEMRKYRIETFANAMERIPLLQRNLFGKIEIDILKTIYGENGIKYINENCLITDNVDGMLKYLSAKVFKENENKIDFQTLRYIKDLKTKAINVDSIVEILKNDQITNMQKREEFIKRKGKLPPINRFDKQEQILNNLIDIYMSRRQEDIKQNQENIGTPIQGNMTREDQEWEMIKAKYNYESLGVEKQQELEDQFREIIYKRRLAEIGVEDDLFQEDEKENEVVESVEKTERRLM